MNNICFAPLMRGIFFFIRSMDLWRFVPDFFFFLLRLAARSRSSSREMCDVLLNVDSKYIGNIICVELRDMMFKAIWSDSALDWFV